jgi:hypothetical protein
VLRQPGDHRREHRARFEDGPARPRHPHAARHPGGGRRPIPPDEDLPGRPCRHPGTSCRHPGTTCRSTWHHVPVTPAGRAGHPGTTCRQTDQGRDQRPVQRRATGSASPTDHRGPARRGRARGAPGGSRAPARLRPGAGRQRPRPRAPPRRRARRPPGAVGLVRPGRRSGRRGLSTGRLATLVLAAPAAPRRRTDPRRAGLGGRWTTTRRAWSAPAWPVHGRGRGDRGSTATTAGGEAWRQRTG